MVTIPSTSRGSLGKLALQFASQNPEIPTTLFSSASPASVTRNVLWHEEPFDPSLVERSKPSSHG
jgi:hypothetical protein